jgi:type IV pilus assembly protein PilQ
MINRMISIGVFCCVIMTTAQAQSPVEIASKTAEAYKTGKFTGSPITIKLKDADVHEVLRMIGETSGFNIVIHPAVTGKVTLSMEDVPWDQALDIVLSTLKLSAERNESVLRVLPKEMMIAEKRQELDALKLTQATAPRVTRVFPISYADINNLSKILQQFVNSQTVGDSPASNLGTIIVDSDIQSLIVRDTAENIDKIKKMIEILDVQTPQVLIEGKVVEASEDFSKSIDGNFGIGGNRLGAGFNGAGGLLGSTISLGDSKGGFSAAGLTLFKLANGTAGLSASLQMSESESKLKVVSSPRTVVLSGKSATITQGKTFAVKLVTPPSANNPGSAQIVQVTANTRLNVTPRVTNDGSVFMNLNLTREVLKLQAGDVPSIQPRTMETEVIIESGNTLVIGGVLNMDESNASSGIPFLRNIPIFGTLFGNDSEAIGKSELMFFITPRILNQKKTGIVEDEPAKL